jgi:hypothetical protein
MNMAGELDDRWLALSPPKGEQGRREESPDTALRQQRKIFGPRAEGNGQRAW